MGPNLDELLLEEAKLKKFILELNKSNSEKLQEKCRDKFFEPIENRFCHCGGRIGSMVYDFVQGFDGDHNIIGPGSKSTSYQIVENKSEIHCEKCKLKYYD